MTQRTSRPLRVIRSRRPVALLRPSDVTQGIVLHLLHAVNVTTGCSRFSRPHSGSVASAGRATGPPGCKTGRETFASSGSSAVPSLSWIPRRGAVSEIRCGFLVVAMAVQELLVAPAVRAPVGTRHAVVGFQHLSYLKAQSTPPASAPLPAQQRRRPSGQLRAAPQPQTPVHPVPVVGTACSLHLHVAADGVAWWSASMSCGIAAGPNRQPGRQ
jgi:hypothetical protein